MNRQDYVNALKTVNKLISIHKSINGEDVEDTFLASLLMKKAIVQSVFAKYDDAYALLKESEKSLQKLAKTDPTAKEGLREIEECRKKVASMKE